MVSLFRCETEQRCFYTFLVSSLRNVHFRCVYSGSEHREVLQLLRFSHLTLPFPDIHQQMLDLALLQLIIGRCVR